MAHLPLPCQEGMEETWKMAGTAILLDPGTVSDPEKMDLQVERIFHHDIVRQTFFDNGYFENKNSKFSSVVSLTLQLQIVCKVLLEDKKINKTSIKYSI